MTPESRPPDEGYRGPQVCKIVNITYRQLDHWTRTELVRPSIAEAKGSGTQRLYSYRDLVELKVIKSLLDGGLSLQSVRKVIEYLRSNLGSDLATASLVIEGQRSVLARTGEEIVDLVRQGQGVLNIVPLANVKQELDAKILEFAPLAADVLRATSPPGSPSAVDAAPPRPSRSRVTVPAPTPEPAPDEVLPHEQVRFAHNSERQFAKLLDFYGIEWAVRATDLPHRVRPARAAGAGVHPRLPPAGVRPVRRDHDAEPAPGDEEEPQGPPRARALRDQREGPVPARLPRPTREVRPRRARRLGRRGHGRRGRAVPVRRRSGTDRPAAGGPAGRRRRPDGDEPDGDEPDGAGGPGPA